jgi:hypothetical protein
MYYCIAGYGLYLVETIYSFLTLVNKPHTPLVSDPCFHLGVSLLFLFIICLAGYGFYLIETIYSFLTLVNKHHTPLTDPCVHLAAWFFIHVCGMAYT